MASCNLQEAIWLIVVNKISKFCNLQNLIFEDWISKIHFVFGNRISSNQVYKNSLIDKTGLNVVGI